MKIIDATRPEENLSWCKPFVSNDGKTAVIVYEDQIQSILHNGSNFSTPTAEQLKELAMEINPYYNDFSWHNDAAALLDALDEVGCSGCPWKDICHAVNEEAEYKFEVRYGSGMARFGEDGVDYMICRGYFKGEEFELYAEESCDEAYDKNGNVIGDEFLTFEPLKEEIIRQAEKLGIDPCDLDFGD